MEGARRGTAGNGDPSWEGLGYNRRAVRFQKIARQVLERFEGRLPQDPHELERLDGIGRYTAAAVACFAFGLPTPVVDTNVRRVLGRLLFGPRPVHERDISATARSLIEGLPNGSAPSWSQALMDLGATACTRVQPCCDACPLRGPCVSAPALRLLALLQWTHRPVPAGPLDRRVHRPGGFGRPSCEATSPRMTAPGYTGWWPGSIGSGSST